MTLEPRLGEGAQALAVSMEGTLVVSRSVDRTHERLTLLVRAGELFHQSLDVDDTLVNVARMAVESFADLCLFDVFDEQSGRLYVTAGAHRDPALDPLLKNLGSSILYNSSGIRAHPAVRVSQTGESVFVPVVDAEAIAAHAASREHAEFMRRMGYRSKIVVPVTAQAHIFGTLTFVRTDSEPFDVRDVQAAEELGRRAGLAVANAKQYHREQYVAATLQRAFLTKDFPTKPGLMFHALYRPGMSDAELGGDWYDAFQTPDGWVIVTIGDVTGKGVEAARLMVHLRQSVRIAATLAHEPAAILRIVNEALMLEGSEALATAFVGAVSPDLSSMRYASAGHPPAFLRWEHGGMAVLDAASPPLGIARDTSFEAHDVSIGDGGLLVLYTDGLTEITKDAIAGEARLRQVLESEAALHAANPARYVERAIAQGDQRDDIAIITLQFGRSRHRWRFDVADPSAAYAIRRDLLGSIAEVADATVDELHACELIFGELIGNAVRYAPGPLSISLSAEGADVVLHIIDEGPGFDYHPALPLDPWAESGRGLFLISRLGRAIDVSRLPGYGSYVRVQLPVHARRECDGDDRAQLAS
jgi:serine phosphatase RsbU (regulator of sigma subunit)/anti-sigma regulatory factor (Ser/Thr protein kinase)